MAATAETDSLIFVISHFSSNHSQSVIITLIVLSLNDFIILPVLSVMSLSGRNLVYPKMLFFRKWKTNVFFKIINHCVALYMVRHVNILPKSRSK